MSDNYLQIGKYYFANGYFYDALEYLQASIENDPKSEESYLFLAKTYNAIGNFRSAKKSLFRLLSIDPDNTEAYYLLKKYSDGFLEVEKKESVNPLIQDSVLNHEFLDEIGSVKLTLKSGDVLYCKRNEEFNGGITITAPTKIDLAYGMRPYIEQSWDGYKEPHGDIIIPSDLSSTIDNDVRQGIIEVGTGAFNSLKNIRDVILPNNTIGIGFGAFYASSINHINLPESLMYIGAWAFASSYISGTIIIPRSINVIERNTFDSCINITEIILHDNIHVIKNNAFAGTSISSIKIPGSVSEIESHAFEKCSKLNDIVIESGVKRIYDKAFAHCNSLSKVVLKEGLEYIGSDAFLNCPLSEINIPSTVNFIDGGAFNTQTQLRVILHGLPPNLNKMHLKSHSYGDELGYEESIIFPKCVKIYVPEKYKNEYLSHKDWKDFLFSTY